MGWRGAPSSRGARPGCSAAQQHASSLPTPPLQRPLPRVILTRTRCGARGQTFSEPVIGPRPRASANRRAGAGLESPPRGRRLTARRGLGQAAGPARRGPRAGRTERPGCPRAERACRATVRPDGRRRHSCCCGCCCCHGPRRCTRTSCSPTGSRAATSSCRRATTKARPCGWPSPYASTTASSAIST